MAVGPRNIAGSLVAPSSINCQHDTAPKSRWERRWLTCTANFVGNHSSSSSRNASTSPAAISIPRLRAADPPSPSSFRTTRTRASRSAATASSSLVASTDPSSTTIASQVVHVWRWTLASAFNTRSARSRVGITTDTRGAAMGDAMILTMGDGLGVAVILCTRDRPAFLQAALPAVRAALRPEDEAVVVDSASVDPEVRRVAETAGFRVVRAPRPGLALARNVGIDATTAPIVAFTDDDCRPQLGWTARLAAHFTDPSVGFVTGQVRPDRETGPVVAVKTDEEP